MYHILYWRSHVNQANTSVQVDILDTKNYCCRNQCPNTRLHRLELKDGSSSTPALYVGSSTSMCRRRIIPSWQDTQPQNVHSDIWDQVESYAIHMFLTHQLRFTFHLEISSFTFIYRKLLSVLPVLHAETPTILRKTLHPRNAQDRVKILYQGQWLLL